MLCKTSLNRLETSLYKYQSRRDQRNQIIQD